MHNQYQNEEKAIRSIINRNVKPTDQEKELKIIIYYKNKKTSNLIMKNNSRQCTDDLKKRMVVYQFKCPYEGGCPHSYIGMTTMRLAKRISCHCQEGNIYQHIMHSHNRRPTKPEIENSFAIIGQTNNQTKLRFLEALLISQQKPTLNITNEVLILPTLKRRLTIGNNPPLDPTGNPREAISSTNPHEAIPVNHIQEPRTNPRYNLRPRPPALRQIQDPNGL